MTSSELLIYTSQVFNVHVHVFVCVCRTISSNAIVAPQLEDRRRAQNDGVDGVLPQESARGRTPNTVYIVCGRCAYVNAIEQLKEYIVGIWYVECVCCMGGAW